jgi:hypothetical protein
VQQIFIMGHSVADVDLPYFREIIKNIDAKSIQWKISYHRDPSAAQSQMLKLEINPELVSFARLEEF